MPRLRIALGFFVVFATSFQGAVAPTTHTVLVGKEGSFYDPPTVSVLLNDTVTFVFEGLLHSVVQGSFENPCVPLQGGFDSGFVSGPNTSNPDAQTWDLIVTNVSTTIWYYCAATVPTSHCSSGMVGAINPTNLQYEQFLAKAKNVTAPPPPAMLSLNGVGASAMAPPRVSDTGQSTTSITSTTSSASSTSFSTSTPTQSEEPTKMSMGGVIGGSVAGGVALLAAIAYAIWFLCRRSKRPGSQDFFRYRVPLAASRFNNEPRENFKPTPFISSHNDQAHQELFSQPSTVQLSPSSSPSTIPLSPPASVHPYNPPAPRVHAATSSPQMRTRASPPPGPRTPFSRPPLPSIPTSPSAVEPKPQVPVVAITTEDNSNMRALAREVAAMLSQGQLDVPTRNENVNPNSRDSYSRVESPAPPGYRMATAP